MDIVKDFVISNLPNIIFVVACIVAALFLYRNGQQKKINEMLFYLVSKAESEFGGGTGELKYASVVTWLYERLPSVCKWLFTAKQIDTMIENAVTRMKDYLSKNTKAEKVVVGNGSN